MYTKNDSILYTIKEQKRELMLVSEEFRQVILEMLSQLGRAFLDSR